jgi:hypothetical protein
MGGIEEVTIDAQLSAHFGEHFKDTRGGVTFDYLTGEQVVSRLNDVLTVAGWSFRVLRHDIHAEADEVWALGELVADIDGHVVTRQQFGSQKIKRSRSSGTPLDLGFDLKGATTDALKKCATLLGVGLYLSEKNGGIPQRTTPVARSTNGATGEVQAAEPERDAAMAEWVLASQEATQLGIEHKQLPANADTVKIERWTTALHDKIYATREAEGGTVRNH